MTPAYANKRGLDIMSIDCLAEESGGALPPINCLGGGFIEPKGLVNVNVQIPCVKRYNEDQIVIVMDDPNMKECLVLLGTLTIYHVMPVIKESEINQLAIPWATSQLSWMFHSVTAAVATPLTDVANKTLSPTELNEIVRTSGKVKVPPFGHKIIHGKTGLILQGYKMNVMMQGLEKRLPQLPLGIVVLYSYATLTTGSDRIVVSLQNTTEDWVLIDKGVPIARMEAANLVPQSPLTSLPVSLRSKNYPNRRDRKLSWRSWISLAWLGRMQTSPPRPRTYSWSIMTYFPWKRVKRVRPRQ